MSSLLEKAFEIIVVGLLFSVIIITMLYGFLQSNEVTETTTNDMWEQVEQQKQFYN